MYPKLSIALLSESILFNIFFTYSLSLITDAIISCILAPVLNCTWGLFGLYLKVSGSDDCCAGVGLTNPLPPPADLGGAGS